MRLPSLVFAFVLFCQIGALWQISASAQVVLQQATPQAIQPGKSNRLEITGQNLKAPLRLVGSQSMDFQVESVEPTKAVVHVTLPPTASLGPAGMWSATDDGATEPIQLLVDTLPSLVDNGANHQLTQAQAIEIPGAIDGTSDTGQSDFYRVHVGPNSALAVDLVAQRLGSTMDGFVRVLDAHGKVVAQADDGETGPDCRLRIPIATEGDYVVEVRDNRFVGGGRYRLRLGDLPLFEVAYPLAMRPGVPTAINLLSVDGTINNLGNVTLPATFVNDRVSIGTAASTSAIGAWSDVMVRDMPLYHEPLEPGVSGTIPNEPIAVPCGISGRIDAAKQQDTYRISGTQGQTVRLSARTRSLNSPAWVRLELFHPAGQKIAETPVNDSDEWSIDVAFPETGIFKLQVSELLERGGPTYAYWLEIVPAGRVAVIVKPDATIREQRLIEPKTGATAVDVQVQRFGYDGPVQIAFADSIAGLRIVNPIIPAQVNETKIYLAADPSWTSSNLSSLRWTAKPVDSQTPSTLVSSTALRRLKAAHQPFPPAWMDGQILAAGVAPTDPFFSLVRQEKVSLPRGLKQHTFAVNVNRLHAEYKEPVQLVTAPGPAGWSVQSVLDKDTIQVTLNRLDVPNAAEPSSVQIFAYGEFKGRGRLESIQVPIETLPSSIEPYPTQVNLRRSRDSQRVVLTGREADNVVVDWTERAKWSTSDPAVAVWDKGELIPKGNGQCELVAEVGPIKVSVPVVVEGFEVATPVEFENEVLVSLSKQGCNSGACHGAPSGKGNFRLSLRAFDKALDSLTLIREDFARRVNPMEPDESLLLKKPLMKVPHGGGMHLHRSDKAHSLLREWIAQGAPADSPEQPRCVRLEVFPKDKRVMSTIPSHQQLVVTAHFANGTSRDVTNLVSYESSHTAIVSVSKLGRVDALARGESVILVRFLEHIESVPFLVVEDVPGFEWQPPAENNFIDGLVDAKLRQLQYAPSPLCSDSVFLRRVFLDVIGILPTVAETQAFLADPAPDKRNRLIDALLERPEYAKYWALKWGDLLRITTKKVSDDGAFKYHRWVEQAIRDNMPYNEFAKQLLASSGSTFQNPPANFYRTATDTNDCVETISQVFMGARLQCAKCHNHPFERWTQDNYYGVAAFFQRVQRKKTQRPNEMLVWTSATGDVVQPRTGQVMKPWVPIAGDVAVDNAQDRRLAFVAWLTQPDNPFLARVEANRIWSQLFARGIVDPIDDFRDSNPPANRPLLDALTKQFVSSGFDRKQLLRTILQSRTYQASFETNKFNAEDRLYFSHQEPRLLSAEPLLDAINQLTQTEQSFGNLPPGTKATQLPAPDLVKVDFLKTFGQPERSTVCACERSEDSNLSMAIELFNGSTIHQKLRDPNNRFRKAVAEGKPVTDIISDLYLAGLCRPPTDQELKDAIAYCQSKGDPLLGLEDICWVLINTDEFLFQH